MPELNFFDTYVLMAIVEEIVPQQTFFKDRYFPTGAGDVPQGRPQDGGVCLCSRRGHSHGAPRL